MIVRAGKLVIRERDAHHVIEDRRHAWKILYVCLSNHESMADHLPGHEREELLTISMQSKMQIRQVPKLYFMATVSLRHCDRTRHHFLLIAIELRILARVGSLKNHVPRSEKTA